MKGFFITLFVLLFVVCCVYAQTARVVPLSPADQKEALTKWAALEKAQTDWNTFQARIQTDYLTVSGDDPDKGNLGREEGFNDGVTCSGCKGSDWKYYRKGFESGFEFDKSFQFIVPKPAPVSPQPYQWFQAAPAINLNGTSAQR